MGLFGREREEEPRALGFLSPAEGRWEGRGRGSPQERKGRGGGGGKGASLGVCSGLSLPPPPASAQAPRCPVQAHCGQVSRLPQSQRSGTHVMPAFPCSHAQLHLVRPPPPRLPHPGSPEPAACRGGGDSPAPASAASSHDACLVPTAPCQEDSASPPSLICPHLCPCCCHL